MCPQSSPQPPRPRLGASPGRCICCGWGARGGGEARLPFHLRVRLTPGFSAGTNTLHRLHLSGCLRLGTGAAVLRKASGCSWNGRTSYSSEILSFESLWRNRLARSAINRKVGGSSPPRDGFLYDVFKHSLRVCSHFCLLIHPFYVNMEEGLDSFNLLVADVLSTTGEPKSSSLLILSSQKSL